MGKTVITFSDPRARFATVNRAAHMAPENRAARMAPQSHKSTEATPLIPEQGSEHAHEDMPQSSTRSKRASHESGRRGSESSSSSSSGSSNDSDQKEEENVNKFMQKKTGAQGFINFALLGSNAAQLKRIWTTDNEPKFYTLLITLISISIALQLVQLILMFLIGIFLDMNISRHHPAQIVANNLVLLLTSLSLVINFLLSALDMAN